MKNAKRMKEPDKKERKQQNKVLFVFQIICIIVAIICIINIIKWLVENNKNSNILEEANGYVQIEEPISIGSVEIEKFKVNFDEMKKKNNDIFAWIKVNGTEIAYPVVQADNNDFYLTHSLDKTNNTAGWIFADYTNKLDGTDKNLVIYGHNRRDGTMFGTLQRALKQEWYDNTENQYISFEQEGKSEVYQVFSVYQIEAEDYYITTKFQSDSEYENFLQVIKSRSIKNFDVDLTKDDNIITLSTCANNNKYRVVLHAKKVETK